MPKGRGVVLGGSTFRFGILICEKSTGGDSGTVGCGGGFVDALLVAPLDRGPPLDCGVVTEDALVPSEGDTDRAVKAAIASLLDFLGARPRTGSYIGA